MAGEHSINFLISSKPILSLFVYAYSTSAGKNPTIGIPYSIIKTHLVVSSHQRISTSHFWT